MDGPDDGSVLGTLKRSAAAMGKAGVPFALVGSVAAYARGGALERLQVVSPGARWEGP